MARVRPFRGIRPADALAGEIIALPYDVMNRAEAREMVASNPRSFLRITRSDAELPDRIAQHSRAAYDAGRAALERFLEEGLLHQDDGDCFYLYTQTWRGSTQQGLMALCSVDEYDRGTIKKHELTRPTKEQDRVDHIDAMDAQTGLVFLAYRDRADLDAVLASAATGPVAWDVTTEDGVRHQLQVIDRAPDIAAIEAAFSTVDALYIADGHHRSAAASRVSAARSGAGTSGWFLAGIFPDSQLQVLAYNRVVADLNGHDAPSFLAAVSERFEMGPASAPAPHRRGCFTMYLDGAWHRLTPRQGVVPVDDPVGCLDAAVLQDNVLEPILGITDPRRDTRVRFVGGIRGHEALARAVDRGEAAVAFHLYPTGMDQLFDVADAGLLMPPKSTWFEPKLRAGVVLHRII
ncbi:MAG: DUF1015 family protein [Myxococcota bacterium]|nr:DUF1015 family protein [Myxococcota bacterium]MEC8424312.1 DUF1015 family protein [Myxococcota bacterium]